MYILDRFLLNALFFFVLSLIFPSYLTTQGLPAALVASLLFALVNAFLRFILLLLNIRTTYLNYFAFSFFINLLMIYLVSAILRPTFGVSGFLQAAIIAFLITVFNMYFPFRGSNN
ncbi:MAG: phage holin family protein [Actinobacteria bacterium]|nr:phage holin family protein [Actinomycetota bacterium]